MKIILSELNTRMHSCFQTRFYYDIQDLDHFVILQTGPSILRQSDISRGYVNRGWVIRKYKNTIQHLCLTPRSCLVEYLVESIRLNLHPVEHRRVYVR
jgi:hypothetical protein